MGTAAAEATVRSSESTLFIGRRAAPVLTIDDLAPMD